VLGIATGNVATDEVREASPSHASDSPSSSDGTTPERLDLTKKTVHVRLHTRVVFVGPVSAGLRVIAMRLRKRGCLAFSCRLLRAGL
jgi:hypothetical protein